MAVNTGGFELGTSYKHCSYLAHLDIKLNKLDGFQVPKFASVLQG